MPLPDYVTVATTRPETMVADTGVAVNPDDERFEERIGRMLLLPLIGREIPVVSDDAVKPEFGTGAVKVTPGHDPNDWEIGKRHDLPVIIAIDLEARMNEEAGPYAGLTVDDARNAIVTALDEEGFLDHIEDYVHSVGHCSRCKTVIQPLPSEQWWLDVRKEYEPGRSLSGEAARAVRDGRVDRPATLRKGLPALDGQHPGLVHLAAALVGPPDPGLVLHEQAHHRPGR